MKASCSILPLIVEPGVPGVVVPAAVVVQPPPESHEVTGGVLVAEVPGVLAPVP